MITRKAILIQNYTKDADFANYEKHTTNKDIGLVKAYLMSQEGGAFDENEILCLSTHQINKEDLITLINKVDYSFIYYTGHAGCKDRQIEIPLQNGETIVESDLFIENKKQWLFFDCCRTNKDAIPSPKFDFERLTNIYKKGGPKERQLWLDKMALIENFYFVYYTTLAGEFAFTNNDGGYGTQLFFLKMLNLIQSNNIQSIKSLVYHMNTINFLEEGSQQSKYKSSPSIMQDQLFPIYTASASNL
jgi:hypothetical protein